MLDRIWLQTKAKELIDAVEDNNTDPKRYVGELYNTMLYINQTFGQEMERWLLEHHYKVEGQK